MKPGCHAIKCILQIWLQVLRPIPVLPCSSRIGGILQGAWLVPETLMTSLVAQQPLLVPVPHSSFPVKVAKIWHTDSLSRGKENVCLHKKTILGLKCYLQHKVWQPWSFEGEKRKTGFNFCNPKWPTLGFLQCHWRKAMPKKWRLQYQMRGYNDQAGCNLWWPSPKY